MLTEPMLIVSVATLIVSAIVPFLSVCAAQRLVRRDVLRQAAREAFLRVSKDVQNYRTVFLAHHMNMASGSADVLQSCHAVQDMVIALNVDRLLLGLIFDKNADPLQRDIRQVAATANYFFSNVSPPPLETCREELDRAIHSICLEQMKPLWESIQG